ncbi:MAG: hypothetical protein KAQ71_14985, partial [Desulfobulbaceae bacterium]|nr:hypothetical protein [Desulfobulbaceae bacterium]
QKGVFCKGLYLMLAEVLYNMGDIHENEKTDIDSKIREAEAYRSQELFSESLEIYEEILSASSELDPDIQKIV